MTPAGALEDLLRQHHCNSDGAMSVGECVDSGRCGCSCGLLLKQAPAGTEAARAQAIEGAAQEIENYGFKYGPIELAARVRALSPQPSAGEWQSDQLERAAKQIHYELGCTITAARIAAVRALTAASTPPSPSLRDEEQGK
jgi:hypothetical protein